METVTESDAPSDGAPDDSPLDPELLEPFEVHRRSWLFVGVMVACFVVAAAYLWFGYDRSSPVMLGVGAALAVLGLLFAPSLRDFGAPLLVADLHGLRLQGRDGWVGLLWNEIESVRVVRQAGIHGPEIHVAADHAPEVYIVPLGLATDVSVTRTEVELAKRRKAAPY